MFIVEKFDGMTRMMNFVDSVDDKIKYMESH